MLITCVILIAVIYLAAGIWNISRIVKRAIDPAPSTWIMFSAATVLFVSSFFRDSSWDWISGSLGVIDAAYCTSTLIAIAFFGHQKLRLDRFERYYLAAVVMVLAFWYATGSSSAASYAGQALILAGYWPTARRIVGRGENTESFYNWYSSLAAAAVSLYPATAGGKTISMVYTVRTILVVSGFLCLMHRHDKQSFRKFWRERWLGTRRAMCVQVVFRS